MPLGQIAEVYATSASSDSPGLTKVKGPLRVSDLRFPTLEETTKACVTYRIGEPPGRHPAYFEHGLNLCIYCLTQRDAVILQNYFN